MGTRYVPRVSLSTRVLVALLIGVAAGLVLNWTSPAGALAVVAVVEPVGTLFVNAIRVTVIPLVFGSLVVGIATAGGGAVVRRIGGRGIVIFVVLLIASGLLAAIVAPPVLAHVTLDEASVARVRAATASAGSSAAASASAIQTPAQWLVSLVPPNAVSAAAEGAMLPLITFAFLLGVALATIPGEQRNAVVVLFRGIVEAMLVIVRWLLVIAPIGVFALALPLVARLGLSAIGALAAYVVLVSLVAAAFSALVLYPAAALGGRVSLRQFARAALPAQAVAFSSRSSLAALPALIDGARTKLRLPEEIPSFFIPLAVVLFRVGATCGLTTGALFLARVYGVSVSSTQLATVVATAVATSFSIPGIPGGSIIAMVPVLTAVGLPIEGIGILLGVDTIPDMFRTTANVTGQLAAAVIVARGARAPSIEPTVEPA